MLEFVHVDGSYETSHQAIPFHNLPNPINGLSIIAYLDDFLIVGKTTLSLPVDKLSVLRDPIKTYLHKQLVSK